LEDTLSIEGILIQLEKGYFRNYGISYIFFKRDFSQKFKKEIKEKRIRVNFLIFSK